MASRKDSTRAVERLDNLIHEIRGQKIMLDTDLATVYGVTTKRLNESVKRNRRRFPEDFVFQLTPQEFANLRSHFATSSSNKKRSRVAPGRQEYGG